MMPESRSARPATATAAMTSRTVATEIAEGEDSVEVAVAAADVVAEEDAVAEASEEVAEATRTETTITVTEEAETDTEVETVMEVETGTAGITARTEKMASKMEIAADSEEGVVEVAEVEAVVEEVDAGILEVGITAKTADSVDEVVDSDLAAKTTITTTQTVKSKWTNLGSCTFRRLRLKTRTKSSARASALVSTLTNLTISRST